MLEADFSFGDELDMVAKQSNTKRSLARVLKTCFEGGQLKTRTSVAVVVVVAVDIVVVAVVVVAQNEKRSKTNDMFTSNKPLNINTWLLAALLVHSLANEAKLAIDKVAASALRALS